MNKDELIDMYYNGNFTDFRAEVQKMSAEDVVFLITEIAEQHGYIVPEATLRLFRQILLSFKKND